MPAPDDDGEQAEIRSILPTHCISSRRRLRGMERTTEGLTGNLAVVCGATFGVGLGVARELASHGASLVKDTRQPGNRRWPHEAPA